LKLEGDNPGGSIKDRTALGLLRSLEASRQLRAGGRLLESSSGNLAISLAMLARERGYQFTAVLDPKVTAANMLRLHALGAETIVESPDETGVSSEQAGMRQEMLVEDPRLLWTNQYSTPETPKPYLGTAPRYIGRWSTEWMPSSSPSHGRHAGGCRAVLPKRVPTLMSRSTPEVGGPGRISGAELPGIGSSRRSDFVTPNLRRTRTWRL
jgi:cysteine synthase